VLVALALVLLSSLVVRDELRVRAELVCRQVRVPLRMHKLRMRWVHPEFILAVRVSMMASVQLPIPGTYSRRLEAVRVRMMGGRAKVAGTCELLFAVGMRRHKLGVRAELVACQMRIPSGVHNMHVARIHPKSVSP